MSGLAAFTDAQMLEEYQAAAQALLGTWAVPNDEPPRLSNPVNDARLSRARTEIVHRGNRMVPLLVELLTAEVPQDRGGVNDKPSLSLSGNIMDLLVQLDDPGPVPTLVEILDGMHGKASRGELVYAQAALERLTRCSLVSRSHESRDYDRSVRNGAALNTQAADPHDLATRYRGWLAGEGRDPTQWMAIARRRAHELLRSENLDDVYCAAAFLRANGDDQPAASVARLTALIGASGQGADGRWLYRGRPLPNHISQWMSFLSGYGPLARPGAQAMIKVHRQCRYSTMYMDLEHVGGNEILAYLCDECIPLVEPEVARIKSDPSTPKSFDSRDPRLELLQCDFYLSLAIDRWAGRRFASHADRSAWWKANKEKSDEQRLREALPTLAEQVDGGTSKTPRDAWAGYLFRTILPDFPASWAFSENRRRPLLWVEQDALPAPGPNEPISASVWVREQQDKLRFDPDTGELRVAKTKLTVKESAH